MAKSDADKLEDAVVRVEKVARSGCPRPPDAEIDQALAVLRTRLEPVLEPLRPPAVRRPSKEWSLAFKLQAERDLDAAVALAPTHRGASTMLLQMTFEKLAKAALAKKVPENVPMYSGRSDGSVIVQPSSGSHMNGGNSW